MSLLAVAFAVTIRVYDIYGLPPEQRHDALAVAADALQRAGVEAIWVDCAQGQAAAACRQPMGPGELLLRVQKYPAEGIHTLGEAVVHDDPAGNVVATVYASAVAERARRIGLELTVLIGRVAAHEIGHLLIGTRAHSGDGLMRAAWDVGRIRPSDWQFSSADAAAIRARFLARDADLIAAAPAR
jgi:hypothetical protein